MAEQPKAYLLADPADLRKSADLSAYSDLVMERITGPLRQGRVFVGLSAEQLAVLRDSPISAMLGEIEGAPLKLLVYAEGHGITDELGMRLVSMTFQAPPDQKPELN